jgi:starch-binding outer membrane protein, SusD/RagB family
MKNYFLILIAILGLMTSCQKELDRSPLDQFANETFWTSESNALLALTGVYRGQIQMVKGAAEFTATDWWSYHGLLYLDMATDNAYDRRGDNSNYNRLTNGSLVTSNGYISNYWNTSYSRIARSNFFLENIGKATINPKIVQRMKAEAQFIRATQYFYMAQYFGDVPLVARTLSIDETNTVKKATKADITAFVVNELKDAANNLPKHSEIKSNETGRATKQAALAFLGRTYLGDKKFKEAADAFKQIIDLGENNIDPNFQSLFDGTNENSSELLFSVQYQQDLLPNAMQQHNFPRGVGGWHLFNPLGSLAESYDFVDGTPFNFKDPKFSANDYGLNRDPRLRYTILYNNSMFGNYKYVTHPDSVNALDRLTTTLQATRTGFCIKKHNSIQFIGGDLMNSGFNIPIIRYSEVLLSYLEAKIENGDAIDKALLDLTINKVRGRASVAMPAITEISPTNLRNIVRKERREELAFEGIRYWDLLRWGTAGTVLNGDFYGSSYPKAKSLRKKGTITDLNERWFVTSKSFRVGIDERWPVPQNEQNVNPNLR